MKTKTTKTPAALEAAVETAKSATTKPSNKTKEKAAATVAAEKITKDREVKYIYPTDCTDAAAKKAFRHEVRRKIRAYINKMIKLQDSELEEDQELMAKVYSEYEAYQAKTMKPDSTIGRGEAETTPLPAPTEEPKETKAKAKETKAKETKAKTTNKPKDPDASLTVKKKKRKATPAA